MTPDDRAVLDHLVRYVYEHPVVEWVQLTASREYQRIGTMKTVLETLPSSARLRHGAARGGDRLAGQIWAWLGRNAVEFPVRAEQWRISRRAGHDRNQRMVDETPRADLGLAFIRDHSAGATDCLNRMRVASIPVFVFSYSSTGV